MNMLSKQVVEEKALKLVTYAVALGTLAACEDPLVVEPIPSDPTPPPVTVQLSTDFARAGEMVEIDIGFSDRDLAHADLEGRRTTALRATVSWNAAAFEYVESLPSDAYEVLGGGADDGWMMLEISDADLLRSGHLELHFRALVDADTSRFVASAILVSRHEDRGDVVN